MGRRAQGAVYLKRGGIWSVRFRIAGKRHEYSTGIKAEPKAKRPSDAAVREGEQIYAACLQGRRVARSSRASPTATGTLAELLADWLDDLAARAPTREKYEKLAVTWLREWKRVSELTEAAVAAYFRRRLRGVTRKTADCEASALRRFGAWAYESGAINVPIAVPTIPRSVSGTPYSVRRRQRAPDLSSQEVEAILALLPERSESRIRELPGFPVRARFELMWETTLRPATLDKLSVPENWAPGERVIRLEAADDKEAYGREIPLTERARKALERVAPVAGIIFGEHKYHRYLGPAAAAALPAAKARVFTGQHVRSAAITRALERSSNLAGVMHLAGHKHASTTSRYVRPTFRAAEAVIAAFGGDTAGDTRKV
jgi:integrase